MIQLTELKSLDLRNNRIYGAIPPEFWLLPELSRVELSSTGLQVRFPQQRLPDQLTHLCATVATEPSALQSINMQF